MIQIEAEKAGTVCPDILSQVGKTLSNVCHHLTKYVIDSRLVGKRFPNNGQESCPSRVTFKLTKIKPQMQWRLVIRGRCQQKVLQIMITKNIYI